MAAAREWSRRCPQCGAVGPVRLAQGEVCASCRGDNAWAKVDGVLVIDRATIDDAVRRRDGENAIEWWRRALASTPLIISLGLAAAAAVSLVGLLAARPIGPLDDL